MAIELPEDDIADEQSHALDDSQRRNLTSVAFSVANDLGDGTDVAQKAIEYMRSGFGDEYYDYHLLENFFSLCSTFVSFADIDALGMSDAVVKLQRAVNGVSDGDVLMAMEAEKFVCYEFGTACEKYKNKAVEMARKSAWAGYGSAVSNLASSFFDSVFDCEEFISEYIMFGRKEILRMARERVSPKWHYYLVDATSMRGSLLGFLSDCGDGAVLYRRSLEICQMEFMKRFSSAWKRIS